ncbi:hypothetical protein DSECCO2_661560 [anaerobic digester metagenome]
MTAKDKKMLSTEQLAKLFIILKTRFEKNIVRHDDIEWDEVADSLENNTNKVWTLNEMQASGGEPDVVSLTSIHKKNDEIIFVDCSPESPIGRRSICYDQEALESRKENKPKNSAMGMAADMGIELLTEEQYRELQQYGNFDSKTSSWVKTPAEIRKSGGALFCDRRYNTVFVYHNGAESYYAVRGFRGFLKV